MIDVLVEHISSFSSKCILQIFCDKGAERKARDEERRAAKRRMTSTGAKKRLDDMYHTATERSEFYTMENKDKQPVSSWHFLVVTFCRAFMCSLKPQK